MNESGTNQSETFTTEQTQENLDSQAGDITSQTQEENINVEVKKENQENINVVVNNSTENQSNHIVDAAEADLNNENTNNVKIESNIDQEVHNTEEKIEIEATLVSKENERKLVLKFLEKSHELVQQNEVTLESQKTEEKNTNHIEENDMKEATQDVVENVEVQAVIVQEKLADDEAETVEVQVDIREEKVAEEVEEISKVQSEIKQETCEEDTVKTAKEQEEIQHEKVADPVEETNTTIKEQPTETIIENAIQSNEKKNDEEIKLPVVDESSQEKVTGQEVVIENNIQNDEHKNKLEKEVNHKEEVGKSVEEKQEKTVETLKNTEIINQNDQTESKLSQKETSSQIEPISVSANTFVEEVKDNLKVVIDNEVHKTILNTKSNEAQTVETEENNTVDITETMPSESKQILENEAKVNLEVSKRKMDQQAEMVKMQKDRIVGEVSVGKINNFNLPSFRQKRNNNFTKIGKVF